MTEHSDYNESAAENTASASASEALPDFMESVRGLTNEAAVVSSLVSGNNPSANKAEVRKAIDRMSRHAQAVDKHLG